MTQRVTFNNQVIVRLEDVICPELEVIMAHFTGEAEIVGKIKFLSEGAGGRQEFAIIEVPGIMTPLVVSRSKLTPVSVPRGATRSGRGSQARDVTRSPRELTDVDL